jgi:signal transduction histidine kinase
VRRVRIAFEQEAGRGWWASVSDNALGIEPEHQGRILDRFFRAHPDVAEGAGLGLSIAQDATQQLGSRVEFESEPGVGTTFRFFLPKPEEEDSAEAGSR